MKREIPGKVQDYVSEKAAVFEGTASSPFYYF
jgi:hypothetical protein